MPVGPPPLANRLVGVVPRLNRHVRHQAFGLPDVQIFSDKLLHALLALKICGSRCGKPGVLTARIQRFFANPLDSKQALLKDVVRMWLKVGLFPAA